LISKILIANRGEIAVRIIRAAKELGKKSVVVYSTADKDSLAVKLADEKVCVGPPSPMESYLYYQNILSAAITSKADAIHPGYGFLAENPAFAEACRALNINFIGPKPIAMRRFADKIKAKQLVEEAGVPVIPGSKGDVSDFDEAKEVADDIGYPLIVKACSGGGGRGMRIVNNEKKLENAIYCASIEAQQAFGDPRIYIEKYISNPKHIEIQILSDKYGNTVHLFERDCSIQRKYQKILEEAPSSVISKEKRKQMGEAAIIASKAALYESAGTVEFLYDLDEDNFYFIEMNTRIQVEHPVTEEITGVDLIKSQIMIEEGDKLSFSQEDISILGHCIECRINAEDSEKNFSPTPGLLEKYIPPGGMGVRIDSGVYQGYYIPPFYDSMIAKLIVWGKDRKEAINRMKRSLEEFIIDGVKSTIPFHLKILNNKMFLNGQYTINFVEKFF